MITKLKHRQGGNAVKTFPRYDLDEIDRRFPNILTALGWKPTRTTPKAMRGPCPIHHGDGSNFHLDLQADGKWVAICRSQCGGTGWTATRFVAEFLSVPHKEAIPKAAELSGIHPASETSPFFPRRKRIDHAAILRAQEAVKADKERITQAIVDARPGLLAPHLSNDWKYDLWEASEIRIPHDLDEQAHLVARHLFHPDEILWMGKVGDTSKPYHAAHFRPREEWMKETRLPPRMAPGVFRPGSYSRCGENITSAPFILIESDDIIGKKPETQEERNENRQQCAALIGFMRERFSLTLRALIDTGGKSLHAWIDQPPPDELEAIQDVAEGLAIDPPVITAFHNPLRLPGCVHEGTKQPARLLYLNPRTF